MTHFNAFDCVDNANPPVGPFNPASSVLASKLWLYGVSLGESLGLPLLLNGNEGHNGDVQCFTSCALNPMHSRQFALMAPRAVSVTRFMPPAAVRMLCLTAIYFTPQSASASATVGCRAVPTRLQSLH